MSKADKTNNQNSASSERGSSYNIHLYELSLLKQVISSLSQPIYIKNSNHEFTFMNDAYCKLVGFNYEDIMGKTEYDILPKNIAETFLHSENNVLATGKPELNEEAIVNSEGNIIIIKTNRRLVDFGNEDKVIVCTVEDFSGVNLTKEPEDVELNDNTDFSNYETEIDESPDKFQTMLNQIPDAILIINWKGELLYFNRSAAKLVEFNPKQKADNINVLEFVHPSFRSKVMIDILSVKKDQGGYLSEYKIKTSTGKNIWVEGLGAKVKFENQHANLVVLREITDRKHADVIAEKTERQYRLLFNSSPIGVMQYSSDLIISDCNERFAEILKINRLKLIGLDMTTLKDQSIMPAFYESLKGNTGYYEGLYHTTLSDRKVWISLRTSPIINENEEIESLVAFVEDISERKAHEESLKKRDEILKSISLSAESFLKTNDWEKEVDDVLTKMGKASDVSRVYLFRNYTTTDKDLKLRQTNEYAKDGIVPQIDNPDLTALSYHNDGFIRWYNSLRKGETIHGIVKNFPKSERIILESQDIKSILIVPIFVRKYFWGLVGFDDCTYERIWTEPEIEALKTAGGIIGAAIERKAFESRILKAKEEAEKSEKLKSEFLAQMSHEIRTPLNVLLNFNEEIEEEVAHLVSSELKENFGIVKSAGNRIIKTVDLILNMSSVQSGNYETKFENFDLNNDIIQPLIKEYKSISEEKNIELEFKPGSDIYTVEADRYSIEQIFYQLIDNAVKYTESGSVTVKVTEFGGNIKADIIDTGIGISDTYKKKMFEPFSQEEHGYTRSYDGCGLGLALVNRLCRLNNIGLSFTSEKGKGTTFSLSFQNSLWNLYQNK